MEWDKIDDYLKNEVFRKVDIVATRKRVERLARLYVDYKSKMLLFGEQKVTASYHLNGSTTNKIYNSNIEKVAMFNLDNEYHEIVTLFEGAMKSLEELEYQIFYNFYIKQKTGIACYVDLGITESEFYRVKNKAIEKVALFLGCAVFKEK